MSNRKRKCKFCGTFKVQRLGVITNVGFFCCYDHAAEYGLKQAEKKRKKAIKAKEKKERKERQERREKLKDKRWYLKKAQQVFNRWIRERDKNEPCISCQRRHKGQYHAGHYRTTAAAPQLRFDESNVFKQCAPCNNHLSGNIGEYRINLIKKIGLENVEALENNNELKRWTIEELKQIIERYKLH